MTNSSHTDTRHILEARAALNELQAEICKLEYLAKTNLPQVEYLQDQIADHARQLAAGLVSLARVKLEVEGIHELRLQ